MAGWRDGESDSGPRSRYNALFLACRSHRGRGRRQLACPSARSRTRRGRARRDRPEPRRAGFRAARGGRRCGSGRVAARADRYTYAPGERGARKAIAARASAQAGREVDQDRVVFFPGSQAALFATMLCLVEAGDEVILGEPAYSTYPGVLAAAGATAVDVPLRPEEGFHLRVEDVAAAVTPRDAGDPAELTAQSDRGGDDAGGARGRRGAVPGARPLARRRRGLRVSRLGTPARERARARRRRGASRSPSAASRSLTR